jgi:putative hydrolase
MATVTASVAPGPEPSRAPNYRIAEKLRQAAALLAEQGANPFRISAYRRAADAILRESRDLRDTFETKGMDGLLAVPHVGRGIGAAIVEMLRTGHWSQLERLRGTLDPVHVFQTVPGLGPALAQRVHDLLGVDTLEGLEIAAHDGRLETVPGIGARRAMAVRAALGTLLGSTRTAPRPMRAPAVSMLLDVDREYREKATAGALRTIAPRRFNPEREAWFPVLHTRRGPWHFTALYSNTARAHELGRTRDWVVIYSYDDTHQEAQHTVVTETQGPLVGQRVVRGREPECHALHATRCRGASRRARRPRPDAARVVPAAQP